MNSYLYSSWKSYSIIICSSGTVTDQFHRSDSIVSDPLSIWLHRTITELIVTTYCCRTTSWKMSLYFTTLVLIYSDYWCMTSRNSFCVAWWYCKIACTSTSRWLIWVSSIYRNRRSDKIELSAFCICLPCIKDAWINRLKYTVVGRST